MTDKGDAKLDLDVVNEIVNDQIMIMVDKIRDIKDAPSPSRLQFALMHCLLFKTLTVIIELDGPQEVIPRVMDLLVSALKVTGHAVDIEHTTVNEEVFKMIVGTEEEDKKVH